MTNIPDFDEVFAESRKTPQEVGRMLDEWLAGESEGNTNVEKYGSSTNSSVEQKMEELMNTSAAI